jgi:uncharacterized protein
LPFSTSLISHTLVFPPMKLPVWIALLLLVPSVLAQTGTIKLLALSELSDGTATGAVADLELRVEPGEQRVYLETFPLTKITTQISMRFAQQVACKELDIDCSDRDFYFTIKALPGIVGGPSAGSAAAVLTASLITGYELRNDTAITGTINSGGIIGPVGGLKEKITAAATSGMKRVLIPRGTSELRDNDTNKTTDLVKYGKLIDIEVIEVSTLLEAMKEYTGREFPRLNGSLEIEPGYLGTMKAVSVDLCNRTERINASLASHRTGANTTELEQDAVNFTARASDAFNSSQYYASASFCFRANVLYKQAWALQRNWTAADIIKARDELIGAVANYSDAVDSREIRTITDLQTYMSVKERLFEAEETLAEIHGRGNETNDDAENLAYAEERLFSAKTWARFFNGNEASFVVGSSSLKDSCIAKISEAEERISYVKSYLPDSLEDTRAELDKAYKDLSGGKYTLCLYKASKTKSEADVILGIIGVEAERIDELIDLKREIARDAIIKSQQKGIFPIIGYSYYEYSGSLKPIDKYSSLLFAEYALEFSNLDIYFPKAKTSHFSLWKTIEPHVLWILGGIILGIIISIISEAVQDAMEQMKKRKKAK